MKSKTATRAPMRVALAAAFGAVCGSASAQSSVNVYGIVSQDVVHVTNAVRGRYFVDNGRLNASRLGFKGSEDLGGGLAAIFDIESGINPDTGAANGGGTFWNRGSYVGLKSGYGTLTVGRQWNVNDDILGNFFIFGGYAVFSFNGFGETSDLFNNSFKYVSPSFGGFTFEALGALSEGVGPRTWEVAGSYAAGPLKAALTYHESEIKATGLKDKLFSGGVSYLIGDFNLRFGYSTANNELSFVGLGPGFKKATAMDFGVNYAMNALYAFSLDYVTHDVKNTSSDSHFLRLLGTYNFSKRTQLNANLVLLKNKGTAVESFYGINGTGKSQTVIGAGLSHFF